MLKNVLNITLIITLLISTTGYTISRHYCGSRLVSIAINTHAKSCCDNDDCKSCHNESEHVHLNEDYILSTVSLMFDTGDSEYSTFIQKAANSSFHTTDHRTDHAIFSDSSPPSSTPSLLAKLQKYRL